MNETSGEKPFVEPIGMVVRPVGESELHIASGSWTPDKRWDLSQTVPQREREMAALRGEVEIDPKNIIFVQKGEESRILEPEEKALYRSELTRAVLGKLERSFDRDTKLYGIYEEISKAKEDNPEVSLFTLIHSSLETLVEEPEAIEVKGEKLTNEEIEVAKEGLRDARRIITEAAKDAGLFDALSESIDGVQQKNPDYLMAIEQVRDLKSNFQRLDRLETRDLNRSHPDFAGVSTAYINGAIYNMEYYLEVAQAEFYNLKAGIAATPQEADRMTQFSEESKAFAEMFGEDRFIRHWGKPRPYLATQAMQYLIRRDRGTLYAEQQVGEPGLVGQQGALKAILDELKKRGDIDDKTYELERKRHMEQMELYYKGHEQFVHAVTRRTYMNPEQFDQQLPNWFEYKDASSEDREKYQEANRFALNAVALAYVKELTGARTYEAWMEAQGIRFYREQWKAAWDEMPGFRQAMLTMSKDLFEESDSETFEEGGLFEGKKKFVLSERGYEIFSNKDNLKQYKEKLISALGEHLKDDPELQRWAEDHVYISPADEPEDKQRKIDEGIRNIIQASVYTADNFYFATGSYDSAYELRGGLVDEIKEDEQGRVHTIRKMGHSEYAKYTDITTKTSIGSDAVISWMHPGKKLEERILKVPVTRAEALGDEDDEGGGERRYAGPVGNWVADNVVHTRRTEGGKTFRGEFLEGGRRYIPDTLFFSVPEMVQIQRGDRKVYLSDVLIDSRKSIVETDERVDFQVEWRDKRGERRTKDVGFNIEIADLEEEARVDMEKMACEEMWGFYMDMGNAAKGLSEHLTSGDSRKRLDTNQFLDSYIKLRGKPRLKDILTDRNYLEASIGLIISPEKGFRLGQTELLLDIDELTYQAHVNHILSDDRLFLGMGAASREELLKAYKSGDENKYLDVLVDMFFSGTFIMPRSGLRRRAKMKKKTELEELQEAWERDRQRQATNV